MEVGLWRDKFRNMFLYVCDGRTYEIDGVCYK